MWWSTYLASTGFPILDVLFARPLWSNHVTHRLASAAGHGQVCCGRACYVTLFDNIKNQGVTQMSLQKTRHKYFCFINYLILRWSVTATCTSRKPGSYSNIMRTFLQYYEQVAEHIQQAPVRQDGLEQLPSNMTNLLQTDTNILLSIAGMRFSRSRHATFSSLTMLTWSRYHMMLTGKSKLMSAQLYTATAQT